MADTIKNKPAEESATNKSGASKDTPTEQAGASNQDTLPVAPPTTKDSPRNPARKRICGAEAKRRRKARLEALKSGEGTRTESTTHEQARLSKPPARSDGTNKTKQLQTTAAKKRLRSQDTLPSPSSNQGKRAKKTCPANKSSNRVGNVTYKEAAGKHLRVAVIDRSNPLGKLDESQAKGVENSLTAALDAFIAAVGNEAKPAPTFDGLYHSGQILRITCSDQSSLDWLRSTVANLPPLWQGAILDVVQVDDLPRLTKVTLWIPGEPEPTEMVTRRLAAQNTWAKLKEWCVFHDADREEPKGKLLVFGVGQADSAAIKTRGERLNYKFTSLKVKMRKFEDSSASETPAAPALMETDASPAMGAGAATGV